MANYDKSEMLLKMIMGKLEEIFKEEKEPIDDLKSSLEEKFKEEKKAIDGLTFSLILLGIGQLLQIIGLLLRVIN